MKIKSGENNKKTLSIGNITSQKFRIDTDNGVIFDILRNKMYSNKIAAVAREISSNARDANRENKKSDKPIKISIVKPNVLVASTDSQIVFQDEGIGITPDRMANIFLLYGASTKRTTNRQTGGFGLGAKTPFAYSDTFTVITICEVEGKKMKFIYTATITDKDGKGQGEMQLFDQEKTTENTGTSIIVPFQESDREEFEKEIFRATAFWKTKPELIGFRGSHYKFKDAKKGKGFRIVDDEDDAFSGYSKYLIVIDGIPYEADIKLLEFSRNAIEEGQLMLLEYKTGDLTISANREAVQYDRQTKTKLLWKYRAIKRYLVVEVEAYFAGSTSYLDACIRINNLSGNHYDLTSEETALAKARDWLMYHREATKYNGIDIKQYAGISYFDLI